MRGQVSLILIFSGWDRLTDKSLTFAKASKFPKWKILQLCKSVLFYSFQFCLESWDHDKQHYRLFYGLSVLVIRSAIPLILISLCHWRIAHILNTQTKKFQTLRSARSVIIAFHVTFSLFMNNEFLENK